MPSVVLPLLRPERCPALVLLLGVGLSGEARAVQLPVALLPSPPPITVPAARPLAGIDDWRLHGLFSSSQPDAGWALLSLGDGVAISVRVGDSLPGDVRVQAVERDHLWLQRGGEQALLYLQRSAVVASQPHGESAAAPADPLPEGCAAYAAAGVPVDELITLGGCPSAGGGVVLQ